MPRANIRIIVTACSPIIGAPAPCAFVTVMSVSAIPGIELNSPSMPASSV